MRINCRFLVVDSNRILPNAQIVVRDGRIEEINDSPDTGSDLKLPEMAILPGLINAHTHLEFSDLSYPIKAGTDFPEWISRVVKHRRQATEGLNRAEFLQQRRHCILRGLWESGTSGTALLVDIVTNPWSPDWLTDDPVLETLKKLKISKVPIETSQMSAKLSAAKTDLQRDLLESVPRVIPLAEILGLEPHSLRQSIDWAQTTYQHGKQQKGSPLSDSGLLIEIGISPHSPYTLPCAGTFEQLKQFPDSTLTAMHLAESREELQWLSQAEGPFSRLFHSLSQGDFSRRMQIDQAIEWLCSRQRSLLVHGNYLTPAQLDRLAETSVVIVYCPRTHQYFGHNQYPLSEIRRRGIPLLLGTDSRASSPDLNLWQDCRLAHQQHPTWPVNELFDSVTRTPAKVLGVDQRFGSLEVGKLAWLNVMPCPPDAEPENLLRILLESDHRLSPCPLWLSGFNSRSID